MLAGVNSSRNPELIEFKRNGFPLKTCGNDTNSYFRVFQHPAKE
jgi:hypothetical protein